VICSAPSPVFIRPGLPQKNDKGGKNMLNPLWQCPAPKAAVNHCPMGKREKGFTTLENKNGSSPHRTKVGELTGESTTVGEHVIKGEDKGKRANYPGQTATKSGVRPDLGDDYGTRKKTWERKTLLGGSRKKKGGSQGARKERKLAGHGFKGAPWAESCW